MNCLSLADNNYKMIQKNNNIGLTTFLSFNYGTCLQAFAIKKALELQTGSPVSFVNFKRNFDTGKQNLVTKILTVLKRYTVQDLFVYKRYKAIIQKRNRRFEDFIKLITTDDVVYHTLGQLENLGKTFKTGDVVVCGSDMIWSTEYQQYFDVYMLKWCGHARRVSYAPKYWQCSFRIVITATI